MELLVLFVLAAVQVVVFVVLSYRVLVHFSVFFFKPDVRSTINLAATAALLALAGYGLDRTVEALKNLL